MHRRHFLGLLAATALADTPPDFTLRIGPVTVEPVKGKMVRTVGYNGMVPGPMLRVPEGKTVTMEVVNDTDIAELVHWHGLQIPSEVDGSAEEGTPMVAPHTSRRYSFANSCPACSKPPSARSATSSTPTVARSTWTAPTSTPRSASPVPRSSAPTCAT